MLRGSTPEFKGCEFRTFSDIDILRIMISSLKISKHLNLPHKKCKQTEKHFFVDSSWQHLKMVLHIFCFIMNKIWGVENRRAPLAWSMLRSAKLSVFPWVKQRWCEEVKKLEISDFIEKRGFFRNQTWNLYSKVIFRIYLVF